MKAGGVQRGDLGYSPCRGGRGHTLFEFAVVVMVFAVVLGVGLQSMGFYQRRGELAVVQAIQINLRSALDGKIMALQARDRENEVLQLVGQNPVDWLERPPAGYAGALNAAQAQALPAGSWYFDASQGWLVYVRKGQENSSNSAAGNICFRVELLRLPSKIANAEQRPELLPAKQTGVELKEVIDCRTSLR